MANNFVLPPMSVISERSHYLREAIAACSALEAADRLGVITRLASGSVDPIVLAREGALSERGVRLLFAALAGLGLIEATDDGSYRAAMADIEGLLVLRAVWGRLDQIVRDGKPVVAGDTLGGAQLIYPDLAPQLGRRNAAVAEGVAERLAGADLRVLDVGAGAAPWSIAIAARDETCRVTAVDLPAVLAATRKAVSAAGREAQFSYLGGDLFEVELGRASFDLAIAGNLCHLFDEAANQRLLGRLFDVLHHGGMLAIVDALPNERLDGPRSVILYSLGLLIRSATGQVYPFSTYAGWLRAAGYEKVERFDVEPAGRLSLITSRRPL